ncbi:MAG: hypothetical protein ACSHW0_13775 [Thalassotalea sp.]
MKIVNKFFQAAHHEDFSPKHIGTGIVHNFNAPNNVCSWWENVG